MEFEATTLYYQAFDSSGKMIFDGYFENAYQNQNRTDNLNLILSKHKKGEIKQIKYIWMSVNDEQTSIDYLHIMK